MNLECTNRIIWKREYVDEFTNFDSSSQLKCLNLSKFVENSHCDRRLEQQTKEINISMRIMAKEFIFIYKLQWCYECCVLGQTRTHFNWFPMLKSALLLVMLLLNIDRKNLRIVSRFYSLFVIFFPFFSVDFSFACIGCAGQIVYCLVFAYQKKSTL